MMIPYLSISPLVIFILFRFGLIPIIFFIFSSRVILMLHVLIQNVVARDVRFFCSLIILFLFSYDRLIVLLQNSFTFLMMSFIFFKKIINFFLYFLLFFSVYSLLDLLIIFNLIFILIL